VNAEQLISLLGLPTAARVDQRVPKKLLVENGAPTPSDKRQIQDGIEEILWIAALKPETIGIPAYRDDEREYLEIAILLLNLRDSAKPARLMELVHRAIPYPVFLIRSAPAGLSLSLARLRWSLGEKGKTVLDGQPVSVLLEVGGTVESDFLQSLVISTGRQTHLLALYEGWIESFEALAASRFTGAFTPSADSRAAARRRTALADHSRLSQEIATLRARASKEKQINRRVELNLQIKHLEARLAEASTHF
jgi:hypothetical protein